MAQLERAAALASCGASETRRPKSRRTKTWPASPHAATAVPSAETATRGRPHQPDVTLSSAPGDARHAEVSASVDATGAELRVAGRAPELSDKQSKASDDLVATIAAAGHEPPSVAELQERFGPQTVSLLRHLERAKRLVQVEESRYYAPDSVRELLSRLEQGMSGKAELAPTDLRELLGFSRKYLIPFLEYCDRQGYTSRQGKGRIWRGGRNK